MSEEVINGNEPGVEETPDVEEIIEEIIEAELVEDLVEEPVVHEPTCEEQLQEANDEAAKNLDSYLRAQAELANARKRFEKQRALTYVNANADLVSNLLPVLDDFERATETVPESVSEDAWYQGIGLVQRKLMGVLESLNVKEIEALGTPFDPNFHEALGQEPSDEFESGDVTRVMQKGYQIANRVVRPSLVYVAA